MTIYDAITDQMKAAMRAKEKERLTALRNIRAAFINKRKETNADELSDDDCVALLRKLAKQRRDSITAYTDAGRTDLADAEQAELDIISEFVPAGPSMETIRGWVETAIATTNATEMRQLGKVMGAVMRDHRGKVDGSVVRSIASELLSK